MENKKQKPLSLLIEEARENITNAINDTGLNPVLLEPIIKELYNEIRILKEKQYQMDLEQYQNDLDENHD